MTSECPLCNTPSVIEEEENGQVHHVCMECGHILQERAILAAEAPQENGTTTGRYNSDQNTHSKWNSGKGYVSEGRKIGCEFLKTMATMFRFPKEMLEYATDLFVKVYKEKVRYFSLDTKQALCVSCIYVTARDNNYGITVRDLDRFLDFNKGVQKFGAMLKLLKQEYDIHVKDVGSSLEVYNLLSKVDFPLDLIKKTQKILSLLEDLWLVSGKSKTLVIIAAAFVARKCDDPVKNREKMAAFCRMFKFKQTRALNERKNEIYETLRKLASRIPWIKQNEEIKVEYHLDEILEFQLSLKQTAIASAVSEFKLAMEQENNTDNKTLENNTRMDLKRSLEHVKEYGPFLPPKSKLSRHSKSNKSHETAHSGSPHGKDFLRLRSLANRDSMFSSDEEDEVHFDLGSEDDTEDYIIHESKLKDCKMKYLQDIDST